MVCRQGVELVTDYLEGALPRSERTRFEAHLHGCPNCTEYFARMRATISLVERVEPPALSPDGKTTLIELYRRWQAG
jgi:anti-sigma factor RsiW